MIVPESVCAAYQDEYAVNEVHEHALRAAVLAYQAELEAHAWDGRSRGAIKGALQAMQEAHGYSPRH